MIRNKVKLLCLSLVLASFLTACSESGVPSKAAKPKVISETVVDGEVIGTVLDIGIYKSFDEDSVLAALNANASTLLNKPACTCVVKDRSAEGKGLLIGRNMDYSLSDGPVFVYQLNYGKYKTIGITCFSSMVPAEEAKKGLTSETDKAILSMIPAFGQDFLNEKGLYIEMDMRNLDYGTDPYNDFKPSKWYCSGTNPGKGLPDVFYAMVPFYVSTKCSTVPEVIDMLRNKINIYTTVTDRETFKNIVCKDWNLCFMVADALGNYGLIEIADNKIVYIPRAVAQTNFYENDVFARNELFPTGGWGKRASTNWKSADWENIDGPYRDGIKSRYAVAIENLDNIHTTLDMQENMRKIFYSQVYANKAAGVNAKINKNMNSQINPRYEMVQCWPLVRTGSGPDDWKLDFEKGNIYACTFDVLTGMSSSKFNSLYKEYLKHHYAGKSKAQLLADNEDYWVTVQSVVTDIDARKWTVTFFEGTESYELTIK